MQPRRILISRPDRLGDLVITTALVTALKRLLPDVRIALLIQPAFRSLVEDNPLIDAVLSVQDGSDAAMETEIRTFAADVSLHAHPNITVARACRRAAIPMRIGYVIEADQLTHALPDQRREGTRHEIDYLGDLLLPLALKINAAHLQPTLSGQPLPPDLGVHPPYAVFHLGAHATKATVPPDVFAAVAETVTASLNLSVCLIGVAGEFPKNAAFVKSSARADRIHNLCGRLNPAQTFELLRTATFFLGRDSGPAHLAAVAGIRTYCFMPATRADISIARWKPIGPRVTVLGPQGKARPWERTEAANRRVFRGINPSAVAALIAQEIARERPSPALSSSAESG